MSFNLFSGNLRFSVLLEIASLSLLVFTEIVKFALYFKNFLVGL